MTIKQRIHIWNRGEISGKKIVWLLVKRDGTQKKKSCIYKIGATKRKKIEYGEHGAVHDPRVTVCQWAWDPPLPPRKHKNQKKKNKKERENVSQLEKYSASGHLVSLATSGCEDLFLPPACTNAFKPRIFYLCFDTYQNQFLFLFCDTLRFRVRFLYFNIIYL